jgi:hypothetical protein
MDGCPLAGGRDAPLKLAGVRGLVDRKHGGVLRQLAAVGSQMVAGSDASDHRNGGAPGLMAVAHYRALDSEEEGSFEACTHPGARGRVGEGAGGPTAPSRMENMAAGGGEEVGGELDFRRPRSIPSARMSGTTRRRRGSARTGSRGSRTADPRRG